VNSNGVVVGSELSVLNFGTTTVSLPMGASISDQYYASTNCTGAVIATINWTTTTVAFNGTKILATGETADRVNATVQAGSLTFSGPSKSFVFATGAPAEMAIIVSFSNPDRTIYEYPTPSAASGGQFQDVFTVDPSGTVFRFGDFNRGFDANGYPNFLDPTPFLRR
jgi:hypothetical protein